VPAGTIPAGTAISDGGAGPSAVEPGDL